MSKGDAINMTPDVAKVLLEVCSEDNLNYIICHLEDAEDGLEKAAFEDEEGKHDYLFRYAYNIRLIRQQMEKLLNVQGYERE